MITITNSIIKLLPLVYYYDIGIMVRVFANGPWDLDSIPGQVIQMIQKKKKNATWCHLA